MCCSVSITGHLVLAEFDGEVTDIVVGGGGGLAVLVDDGGAEALEFAVTEATKHLNEPLMDIKLKPGILLACINSMGTIKAAGCVEIFPALRMSAPATWRM